MWWGSLFIDAYCSINSLVSLYFTVILFWLSDRFGRADIRGVLVRAWSGQGGGRQRHAADHLQQEGNCMFIYELCICIPFVASQSINFALFNHNYSQLIKHYWSAHTHRGWPVLNLIDGWWLPEETCRRIRWIQSCKTAASRDRNRPIPISSIRKIWRLDRGPWWPGNPCAQRASGRRPSAQWRKKGNYP